MTSLAQWLRRYPARLLDLVRPVKLADASAPLDPKTRERLHHAFRRVFVDGGATPDQCALVLSWIIDACGIGRQPSEIELQAGVSAEYLLGKQHIGWQILEQIEGELPIFDDEVVNQQIAELEEDAIS